MESLVSKTDHIRGLDSIRFICAVWVFFGHGAAPPLTDCFDRASQLGLIATGVYINIWNGPAAVIVFFVISGFCIHYPFAGTPNRPHLLEFYSRRFLRLLIPIALAIPLSKLLEVSLTLFEEGVLWSLLAELIYYIIYPVIRAAQLRFRAWTLLIVGAYGSAFVVIVTNPGAGNYPSYGPTFNWVLGLPCWLLGCALAETVRHGTDLPVTLNCIWSWRAGIFVSAWVCSVLRFHSPIGFPWTLNLFALLVFAWLFREICFRKNNLPQRQLEWAGLWSYSLYLLHPACGTLFLTTFPNLHHGWLRWSLECIFVFAGCYTFYLLAERPSHAIARGISKSLRPRKQTTNIPNEAP